MSVYRDEGRGTWYVQAPYHDSHGKRHRTTKRVELQIVDADSGLFSAH